MYHVETVKNVYDKLVRQAEKFHKELQAAGSRIRSPMNYSEADRKCLPNYIDWLRTFYQMYSELICLGDYINAWEEWELAPDNGTHNADVSVEVTEQNDIIVRLPRMPKKQYNANQFFVSEIRSLFGVLRRENKIPPMPEKLISIINVFSTRHSKFKIPDNLNWDTKKVIDIITDYTGGGDGGLSTFCYMASYQTDKIGEGMYVIVSPDKYRQIINIDDLFTLLKNCPKKYENTGMTDFVHLPKPQKQDFTDVSENKGDKISPLKLNRRKKHNELRDKKEVDFV